MDGSGANWGAKCELRIHVGFRTIHKATAHVQYKQQCTSLVAVKFGSLRIHLPLPFPSYLCVV